MVAGWWKQSAWFALCLMAGVAIAQNQVPSQQAARTAPQVAQVLQSYEGQNVSSVEIAGQPDLDLDKLKSLLAQQPGQPFSREKVDASVEALKKTGRFKDVQLQVVPDIKGIRVLLVLQPGMYFGMYSFPGTNGFAYSRLLQVANYPPEGPYSVVDVNSAATALTRYFQRSGYFQAKVQPEIQPDPAHGLVNVAFQTTLGRKARFGDITIEGTTPEETALLKGKLKSVVARLKGAAIRPGKTYSMKTVQNATLRLENVLLAEERLSAQVKLIGANYDPATNRADVGFRVKVGPVIHVSVQGAHVWSWTKRKLLPVYQQVGTDPEIVQEGRSNLISYFQNKGYFDTQVKVNTQAQAAGDQTIVYQVTKGPRHKVGEVSVAGNQMIHDDELTPVIAVKRGHFLSRGAYSEKLVRTSTKNLEAVYKAEGFSTVKVTPQIKNKSGNIEVTFRVEEGPRDVVEALNVEGNNTRAVGQLAPEGLKVAAGQPYSQKLVDEDRNHIMAHYLNDGYLTATFRETVKPSGSDPHRLVVTYQIYEGPRVTANSVITVGREDTRQAFIDRTAELQAGKPLTTSDMLSSESRLYEPGIFDWAEVDPRREITTQNSEDVIVKVHEAKPNSITYGFGFEVINRGGSVPNGTVAVPGIPPVGLSSKFKTSQKTFWGPRGNIEYIRKNVRGKAETISLTALAGRLDQRTAFNFQDPHFRDTHWASTFSVIGEHDSTNPIFTSRLAETGFQLQRNLGGDKNKNLFLRYSFRETGLTNILQLCDPNAPIGQVNSCNGQPDLVPESDRHVRLSTLSASFIRDTRDNLLDAHKGIYESFEMNFNPSFLGSSVDFVRLLGQTAYYKRVHGNVIWANSLRVGFDKPFNGSHVPLSESFFSGGGSTLRGFPLNGAGPQRTITVCGNPSDQSTCAPTTVPLGGNQLFIVNSEFRIPVPIRPGLGAVAFYDGGNVFRTIGFHGQYTNTLGFGLRYATPVGPVRIDVGHNLNAPPGIKSIQYFITLGQSF